MATGVKLIFHIDAEEHILAFTRGQFEYIQPLVQWINPILNAEIVAKIDEIPDHTFMLVMLD